MYYELSASGEDTAIFQESGFSMGEKVYSYDEISSVNLAVRATAETNGLLLIWAGSEVVQVKFSIQCETNAFAVHNFLSKLVPNPQVSEKGKKSKTKEPKEKQPKEKQPKAKQPKAKQPKEKQPKTKQPKVKESKLKVRKEGKSQVDMPQDIKNKCHIAIHSATTAAFAAGAIPIPVADTIPITTAQVAMIVGLGKVFDITLSQAAAKSIATTTIAQQTGRAIVKGALNMFPGAGTIVGATISAVAAASITEALGWVVADDFYRMSQGEEPVNIVENTAGIKTLFNGVKK